MANLQNLKTVKQFIEENPTFTHGAIRNYIFFEDTNGLKEKGVIKRINRKILIDTEAFGRWVESQNGGRNHA